MSRTTSLHGTTGYEPSDASRAQSSLHARSSHGMSGTAASDLGTLPRYDQTTVNAGRGSGVERTGTAPIVGRRNGEGRPWMTMLTLALAVTGVVLGTVALATGDTASTPAVPATVNVPPTTVHHLAPPPEFSEDCHPHRASVTAC